MTKQAGEKTIRERLVIDFSQWVASCAVNEDIYRALDGVDFAPLFDARLGRIGADEFDRWHEAATMKLCRILPNLNVGWAAKALNEYLKTRCYVGGYGRDGLADAIHPPIDDGLINGLKKQFSNTPNLNRPLSALQNMRSMTTYPKYAHLIQVCKQAAHLSDCTLLESEQFWE